MATSSSGVTLTSRNSRSALSRSSSSIEAVMSIFKTQGLKCVSFLPQVSHTESTGSLHSSSYDD